MSFPLSYYGNWWEYWELYHKVTFDGDNRTITINPGVTAIDVQTDIYSDWKEWSLLEDNLKYLPALSTVGGNPLPGSLSVGRYFFLLNGWKLLVPEDYQELGDLQINGNLFSEDGSDIFRRRGVETLIRQTVSQLTQIDTQEVTGSITVTASLDPNTVVTASYVQQPVQIAEGQVVTASLLPGQQVTASLAPGTEVTASLTPTQETMLLEVFRLLGLDPTKPLVVSPTSRTAGPEITQSISVSGSTYTAQRL